MSNNKSPARGNKSPSMSDRIAAAIPQKMQRPGVTVTVTRQAGKKLAKPTAKAKRPRGKP